MMEKIPIHLNQPYTGILAEANTVILFYNNIFSMLLINTIIMDLIILVPSMLIAMFIPLILLDVFIIPVAVGVEKKLHVSPEMVVVLYPHV